MIFCLFEIIYLADEDDDENMNEEEGKEKVNGGYLFCLFFFLLFRFLNGIEYVLTNLTRKNT